MMLARLALTLLLCLLALPAAADAASRLDPSFGSGGRVIVPFGPIGFSTAPTWQVAQAPDGRLLVASGDGTLLALTANGQPDPSFGSGGRLNSFGPDDHGMPAGFVVDRLGRIVVAATIVPPSPRVPTEPEPERLPVLGQAILLARFTPSGQPDSSFGSGGRLITWLGLPSPLVAPALDAGPGVPRPRVATSGITIDAAGRIVLSGTFLAAYETCPEPERYRYRQDAFLARLDDAGNPDPSFGSGGVAILREGSIGAPVPDFSGGIFAATGPGNKCRVSERESVSLLFHLDAGGAPVAGFGQRGWRPLPEDPFVTILPDAHGGVTLMPNSGLWRKKQVLRRVGANGEWDRSFGHGSTAEPLSAPRGTLDFTNAAIGGGGKIYVAATSLRKVDGEKPTRRFLLFRLDRRGRLDRDYGVQRTGFGKEATATSQSLLITNEGKPLILGSVLTPLLPGLHGGAMARYLSR